MVVAEIFGSKSNFDVVVGGCVRLKDQDEERRLRQSRAEAGASWWLEYVLTTPAEARALVERGPLRVD